MTIQLVALGGDVEHRDEQAEEQQRRAEVALEDQDARGWPARPRGSGRGRGPAAAQAEDLAARPATASRGCGTR